MDKNKRSKYWVLKIIGLAISSILIVLSVVCFISSHFLARPINKIRQARPIYLEVDFSKPGIYSGPISHSRYADHAKLGAILRLDHDSNLTFPEIFEDIQGTIETFDSGGNIITSKPLETDSPPSKVGTSNIKGQPAIWVLYPFKSDQTEIRITVTKPVEKLKSSKQIFSGNYLLNGIEYMAAGIAFMFGIIFLSAGLLIGSLIILVPKYLKRKETKTISESVDA